MLEWPSVQILYFLHTPSAVTHRDESRTVSFFQETSLARDFNLWHNITTRQPISLQIQRLAHLDDLIGHLSWKDFLEEMAEVLSNMLVKLQTECQRQPQSWQPLSYSHPKAVPIFSLCLLKIISAHLCCSESGLVRTYGSGPRKAGVIIKPQSVLEDICLSQSWWSTKPRWGLVADPPVVCCWHPACHCMTSHMREANSPKPWTPKKDGHRLSRDPLVMPVELCGLLET